MRFPNNPKALYALYYKNMLDQWVYFYVERSKQAAVSHISRLLAEGGKRSDYKIVTYKPHLT